MVWWEGTAEIPGRKRPTGSDPETGFEEKSIQPRKLAGQVNGDTTHLPSGWFPQRRGRL